MIKIVKYQNVIFEDISLYHSSLTYIIYYVYFQIKFYTAFPKTYIPVAKHYRRNQSPQTHKDMFI